MKVRLAFPVDEISGKAGGNFGNVFSRWRGLMVARRHVVPANPSTANQDAIRGFMAAAAVAFQSLSPVEKDAWATFAATVPRSILGQNVTIPEISAYCKINAIRQMAGQSITDTAPSVKADFAISDITSVINDAGEIAITFTHSATETAGRFVMVKMTDALPSGVYVPKRSDFRLINGPGTPSILALGASPDEVAGCFRFAPAISKYCGIEIQPISSQYVPGVAFGKVVQVTAPA